MKTILNTLLLCGICCAALVACEKEIAVEDASEATLQTVTATVKLSGNAATKVTYSEIDGTNKNAGLKSVWEDDDLIEAITNTGERVTFQLLEYENQEKTVATFYAQAQDIDEETTWKAILGKNVADAGAAVNCTYEGQDGTVSSLGDYDFIVTTGTGIKPVFDFENGGTRLSYFLRINLPAGIRYIEYNADAYWAVAKNSTTDKYYNDYDHVTEIDLGHSSTSGETMYVAVPATAHHNYINENSKGIIFTFFNSDKTKSYGKVLSSNLTNKGGKISTLNVTTMTLIDRVLPDDAIDFGSVSVTMEKDSGVTSYNNLDDYSSINIVSTKWSPYNLGANWTSPSATSDYYGPSFSWGEIPSKTTFSSENYTYNGDNTVCGLEEFGSTQLGNLHSYQVNGPSGSGIMKLQQIAGTKYDAARVLWGSDWRMPTAQDLMMFTGSSHSANDPATTGSGFTTADETKNLDGINVRGRRYRKGGNEIFFPYAGWYGYGHSYFGARGFYWSDSRIRATPSNVNLTNQPLTVQMTPGSVSYGGENAAYGLAIRPVVNNHEFKESSATTPYVDEDNGVDGPFVYPTSDLYGFITDGDDNPIQGVAVSDGYTFCVTDRYGLYQMKANRDARTVNVTVPADYKLTMDNGDPAYYQLLGAKEDGKWHKDFQLTAYADVPSRATIVAVADPHVKDATTLARFQNALNDVRATVTTLKNSGIPVGTPANAPAGEVICIALGDQMWDVMGKASDIKSAFDGIGAPVFYTIGNHDHDNSQTSDYNCTNAFVQTFGPTNYSFDIANLHVMVMDDIFYTGNGASSITCKEGFTQAQVDWLKADIARVSGASDKIGVLCVHAPLKNASAGDNGTQDAVMSALKNNFKNVHVLSGHTHNVDNNLYHGWTAGSGRSIYEHTLQSISGYWWEADVSYVTGSPAGYGVLTFDSNDIYAEYNKVTKENAAFQMRVYDGGATYNKNSAWDEMMHGGSRGYKEYTWDSPVKNKYVVRLNDPGSSNDTADYWTVSVNGNAMTRVTTDIKDACVASYVFNKIKGTHGDANGTTDHIWYSGANFNSSFTVTATHTMKSGWSATFTSTHYVGTNYKGFAYGESYD